MAVSCQSSWRKPPSGSLSTQAGVWTCALSVGSGALPDGSRSAASRRGEGTDAGGPRLLEYPIARVGCRIWPTVLQIGPGEMGESGWGPWNDAMENLAISFPDFDEPQLEHGVFAGWDTYLPASGWGLSFIVRAESAEGCPCDQRRAGSSALQTLRPPPWVHHPVHENNGHPEAGSDTGPALTRVRLCRCA